MVVFLGLGGNTIYVLDAASGKVLREVRDAGFSEGLGMNAVFCFAVRESKSLILRMKL